MSGLRGDYKQSCQLQIEGDAQLMPLNHASKAKNGSMTQHF